MCFKMVFVLYVVLDCVSQESVVLIWFLSVLKILFVLMWFLNVLKVF